MAKSNWKIYKQIRIAPTFRLQEVNTGKYRYADQVVDSDRVIMTFLPGLWAPWCRKMLRELITDYQHYQEHNLELVVVIAQQAHEIAQYLQGVDLPFRILADPLAAVSVRYGIFDDDVVEPMAITKPSIFILDHERYIIATYVGRHLADRPSTLSLIRRATALPAFGLLRRTWWQKLGMAFGLINNKRYADNKA